MGRNGELPVPPVSLGTSWTARSLLNWVVANADREALASLGRMLHHGGGDQLMAAFGRKAKALNERVAARGHVVPDPNALNDELVQ